jgi:hypothetical protein
MTFVFRLDNCRVCGKTVNWEDDSPTVRCILCERVACGECRRHIPWHREYELESEWACAICWENHLRGLGPEDDKPPPLPDIFYRPEE